MGIPLQLQALGLPSFEGRQHSGIDVRSAISSILSYALTLLTQDARNIARIVAELARRGVCLEPNCIIDPRRRWHWMGKRGEILEYTLAYPDS
jgi:3'-5' exoribonuclease 1